MTLSLNLASSRRCHDRLRSLKQKLHNLNCFFNRNCKPMKVRSLARVDNPIGLELRRKPSGHPWSFASPLALNLLSYWFSVKSYFIKILSIVWVMLRFKFSFLSNFLLFLMYFFHNFSCYSIIIKLVKCDGSRLTLSFSFQKISRLFSSSDMHSFRLSIGPNLH